MESLNLDLLLNAYKEEGKTKDTSMEPLIVFSDDEEGDREDAEAEQEDWEAAEDDEQKGDGGGGRCCR